MFFASMTNGGAYFGVLHAIVIIFNDNNREKKEGREEGLKIHDFSYYSGQICS